VSQKWYIDTVALQQIVAVWNNWRDSKHLEIGSATIENELVTSRYLFVVANAICNCKPCPALVLAPHAPQGRLESGG
jgi:hypothetical protein